MARSGRHLARMCAVQALYQWALTGQSSSQIEDRFIQNQQLSGKHLAYFQKLISAVPGNIGQIDQCISRHLDREMEKVDLIEQAILRIGTYELVFEGDIPVKVILNEAVDLAKVFASEYAYKYVNGVLDKVARVVRKDA